MTGTKIKHMHTININMVQGCIFNAKIFKFIVYSFNCNSLRKSVI